ncbi:MAG TPA: circularly permuted type 2 ATP-grasp protein [Polyangiaceae bacterium]|nr:circularly permuted type 2 ATP-grasp protein [Polyangiaceae bacterium]
MSQSQSQSAAPPAPPAPPPSAPSRPSQPPDNFRYAPRTTTYDESFDADGRPRAHQVELWRGLEALGASEISKRWEQGRRLIRENGVTYNVYGDPRGMDRPWVLDPIPLVISAEEWAKLARGLDQRARLLNALLADLYGKQESLKERLLPPELVFGCPAFLRPLHGAEPPGGIYLHLYATDLARAPDGSFWVMSDRTQAPSGAGYALENRIVVSRLLPQLFRDCRVERLAPFFSALRESLASLAPRGRDQPRVVLLTPGAYNETYFEHAYLARYLGYSLVEGADLTVRDQNVYLKTLGGLERVDVILRRMDDGFCDPLSLRSDSSLGIAGLVRAARRGNVTIANALGSGLVEAPALLAFLPNLCRRLLDETLELPSVATWWCGEETALRYVIDHLPELVIKPATFGPNMPEPVFGGALSVEERAALARRIQAQPRAFVGQEQVALSTAPVWAGDAVQPRHASLRAFVARAGDGYVALPGGLTRVSSSKNSLVVSMQRGGGSKDAWVLASGLPSSLSLLRPAGGRIEIVRTGADLPSRVADNLFWLGRYAERAEGTARLLRSVIMRLTDDASGGRSPELNLLLLALEVSTEIEAGTLTGATGPGRLERRLFELLIAPDNRTLRATIEATYRAGSMARDRLSADTWRILTQLHDQVLEFELRQRLELQDGLESLNRLVLGFSAYSGLVMENTTHGPGWRFADLGRRIERAFHVTRLLRSTLVAADAPASFEGTLEVADSTITYRSRYRGLLAFEPVVDLVLTDETNPRSVAFQLAAIHEHLSHLPRAENNAGLSPAAKTALRCLTSVRLTDFATLGRINAKGKREKLDELLAALETDLPLFADQLTLSYLAHAEPSVSLGSLEEKAV